MTERLRYRELWGQLISENAPLRVIEGDKLVSAPISFFDSMLMSYVTDKWRRAVIVFSSVTISHWDDEIWQTDETFLAARMRTLVESGRVEIRGETSPDMIRDEVRLPMGRRARPPGRRPSAL